MLVIPASALVPTNYTPTNQQWNLLSGMLKTQYGISIGEIAAPSTPASGFGSIYFKADGKLYYKNDAGTEVEVGSGSGDVVGPSSATDENIAVFDSTTGKLIKDGGSKISDLALADDLWLFPPIDDWYDPTAGLPVTPTVGDRYISEATANGWTENYIYEWDGSNWVEYPPEEGWMIWDLLGLIYYVFFSGGWMEVGSDSFLTLDQTASQTIVNGQPIWDTLTASELVSMDANKKLQSLAVATYPSLTELSYVKGLSSAVQTQIGNKQATISFGTGVETALGVNIGSAGAPVVFDGALGTPSGGTATNITGLPLTGLVDDTSTALGVGTLELGHASDTTLARSAAGVLAVEGVVIPSISSTNAFTNKTFDANGTGNALSNVGVADLADGTDGELITYDTDGKATTIANGAVGYVLTGTGEGAAPTFQEAAGGGAITGEIRMWSTSSAPTDWLIANGTAVSRTTYSALFAVISTTYGVGDGSTTFNLPDFRGRTPVGVGTGDASDASAHTLAEKEGAETHQLSVAELATHSHGLVNYPTVDYGGTGSAGGSPRVTSLAASSTSSEGSGTAHNNLQPSLSINFIIKI